MTPSQHEGDSRRFMGVANNRVFVFGSNREGRHGRGEANEALLYYGAVYGQAEGRQGNAYAIVTKEMRLDQPPVPLQEIEAGVKRFLKYAREHPDTLFYVAEIGCGRAGFRPEQIGPMFEGASANVRLPHAFSSGDHA